MKIGSTGGLKMSGWAHAVQWQLVGKNLKCVDNGQLVGMKDNYFYANGENVVDVEYAPVKPS